MAEPSFHTGRVSVGARRKLAALDAAQERALDQLAAARVAEGASRVHPFAGLLLRTRTDLKRMNARDAAKLIRLLVRHVRRTRPGAKVAAACARAERAAKRVLATVEGPSAKRA